MSCVRALAVTPLCPVSEVTEHRFPRSPCFVLPSGGAGPSVQGPLLTASQPDDLSPTMVSPVWRGRCLTWHGTLVPGLSVSSPGSRGMGGEGHTVLLPSLFLQNLGETALEIHTPLFL